MPIEDSDHQEMMQIELAARGYGTSGTLLPNLKNALMKRGIKILDTATAEDIRDLCQWYLSMCGSNA